MKINNLILRTDSYKPTFWPMYPEGTDGLYSYMESRGGKFSETVMFGTHFYLVEYLSQSVTQEMVRISLKWILMLSL
jgi:nicotinamide phosphoribosyltransferase